MSVDLVGGIVQHILLSVLFVFLIAFGDHGYFDQCQYWFSMDSEGENRGNQYLLTKWPRRQLIVVNSLFFPCLILNYGVIFLEIGFGVFAFILIIFTTADALRYETNSTLE
jgi:hypothetical protein